MNTTESIAGYIAGLAESKRNEIRILHEMILRINPGCKLWFLDGKDATGKVVTNPNIGYGAYSRSGMLAEKAANSTGSG